jgi:hypothetical protein
LTVSEIIESVAKENGVTVKDVTGYGGGHRMFLIRCQAVRRLRGTGMSLAKIGRALSGRNHTTVLNMLHGGGYTAERRKLWVKPETPEQPPSKPQLPVATPVEDPSAWLDRAWSNREAIVRSFPIGVDRSL